MRLSVLEGLRSASKQGARVRGSSRAASEIRTGGGRDLQVGLTGAQLPPPGHSPSTEKERKRVDIYIRKYYTRKYNLESTTLTRRLPPTGVGGY